MTTSIRQAAASGLSRFAQFAGMASKPKAEEEPAKQDDIEDVEDKVDEVQEDLDDLEEKVDDLEDEVDDNKDDDEPGDDKPAEQAAFRKGRAAGRKAERARCDAILTSKAAASNKVLAMHLAFDGGMPAKEAVAMLKASAAGMPQAAAAPAPKRGANLDGRMANGKQIALGGGAEGGPSADTAQGVAQMCLAAAGLLPKK